jgi:hypothetical protein
MVHAATPGSLALSVWYLIAGPGIHQAAVAALLAFDRQREQGPLHARRVWDTGTRSALAEDQAALLASLIEALLDLVYLDSGGRSGGPALAWRADAASAEEAPQGFMAQGESFIFDKLLVGMMMIVEAGVACAGQREDAVARALR